jgi:hypothetical protein
MSPVTMKQYFYAWVQKLTTGGVCLIRMPRQKWHFYQRSGSDNEDMLKYFLIPLYNMNKHYSLALWHWSREKTVILMVMKGKAVG